MCTRMAGSSPACTHPGGTGARASNVSRASATTTARAPCVAASCHTSRPCGSCSAAYTARGKRKYRRYGRFRMNPSNASGLSGGTVFRMLRHNRKPGCHSHARASTSSAGWTANCPRRPAPLPTRNRSCPATVNATLPARPNRPSAIRARRTRPNGRSGDAPAVPIPPLRINRRAERGGVRGGSGGGSRQHARVRTGPAHPPCAR